MVCLILTLALNVCFVGIACFPVLAPRDLHNGSEALCRLHHTHIHTDTHACTTTILLWEVFIVAMFHNACH